MVEHNKWQGAVEQIRRSFTAKGRQQLNSYSIEGIRLHERALRAGQLPILTIVSATFWQDSKERVVKLKSELEQHSASIVMVPDAIMVEFTNGRSLGGIISLLDKPSEPDMNALLTAVSKPVIVVAQGIVDPGNVGAMMRTAHANGVTAFIVHEGSDPHHPKAVRTTMGSIFKLPILTQPNLQELLDELCKRQIETVGMVAHNGELLPNVSFSPQGTAVFMGSEYFGLPAHLVDKLDKLVTIPMHTGIDSMSVNAAEAVVLYEIQRQNHK